MKLQGVIPVIKVANLQRQLEFYQQAFRFIILNKRSGPTGLEWVHLKSDNTELMLLQSSSSANILATQQNITLYYYTDDVLSSHRYMKAKGVAVSDLSETAYGMMEYTLEDPEGNKLAIGQIQKH
jgi:uncharacterized glyoxalase superfamily protein PhnB